MLVRLRVEFYNINVFNRSLYVALLCLLSDMVSDISKYPVDNSQNPHFYFQHNIVLDTFRIELQMALIEFLANFSYG